MKKIIDKINDLYILKRKKFLIMNERGYITIIYDGHNKNLIADWRVKNHLKNKETSGVFSGNIYTKFICFDVDIRNPKLAKQATRKLINTLIDIGIEKNFIHVSFSGSKGFHVEIFFDDLVFVEDMRQFYLIILNMSELLNIDCGQVELRPLPVNGVKLPLGTHFKTGNICWFCDVETLEVVQDYNYILGIEKLDTDYFHKLININKITIDDDLKNIEENYTPLEKYKDNIDPEYTVENIQELIQNGLDRTGTRHNSLLRIAKYYRYCGYSHQQAKDMLIEWMGKQDKKLYTTSWDDVIKDIEKICEPKYYNTYTLTVKNKDINVNKNELEEILKVKGKNEKLLLFSMLIHSKRYANKDGIFYMSYGQMAELTGLTNKTVRNLIKKLENLEQINVFRDDKYYYSNIYNKAIKNTNRYRIKKNKDLYRVKSYINFKVCDKNCTNCFHVCLCKLFSEKELKKKLSRKQFENVIKYENYCKNNIQISGLENKSDPKYNLFGGNVDDLFNSL